MATPISVAEINSIRLIIQGGGPASPPINHENIYIKSGGLYRKNSSGTEIPILDSAGLTEALKTPPAIGGITPNTGAFTMLSSSNGFTATGADPLFEREGANLNAFFDVYDPSGGPFIIGRKARGTKSVPLAVQSGDTLMGFAGRGWDATGSWPAAAAARYYMAATETHSSTAHGAVIYFETTKNATTSRLIRMTVDHNGTVYVGQNMPDQFPTQLILPEGTHVSSKRVSLGLGNNWNLLTDVAGVGTRDFGIFSVVQNIGVIFCDVNGVPRFQGLNAATAATFRAAVLNVTSTGTPAAGFGGEFAALAQSATQFDRDVVRLTWEWIVATDASRTGKGKLWAGDSAAWRECIAWAASGTAPLLGLYGNAPVARPTYGAPTGTPTRTTFDTASVTLPQLAERVKAMIDDIRLLGAFA